MVTQACRQSFHTTTKVAGFHGWVGLFACVSLILIGLFIPWTWNISKDCSRFQQYLSLTYLAGIGRNCGRTVTVKELLVGHLHVLALV